MARLALPTVTLCAATSVNIAATVRALEACLDQVDFADCLLFTDVGIENLRGGIHRVAIERIASARDYSAFILSQLATRITTEHCLIVQWDGFVLDAKAWDPVFLEFDYLGAPWPQFDDGYDVGNGGFSLRSRRLLQACQDERFSGAHPEDVAICRNHRRFLEDHHAIRFADHQTAGRFSLERGKPGHPTFGFHGIFNMIRLFGADRFWAIYDGLDDRGTAFVDFRNLFEQLRSGRNATARRIGLTLDFFRALFSR